MNADWKKRAAAEAIGTFGLTFVIVGALCADRYSGGELGLLGISVASGAALAAMAYATRPVSGGHLNPATTVAEMALGRIRPRLGLVYIGAQLVGAGLAGACMAGLYTPQIWEPVNLGTPTLRPEVVFATGVFVEALLTFLLVITALQVGKSGESAAMVYGLAIGLVLMCGTLVGGPLTGAAMNPARAFGPALASGVWEAHAVYWIGPISGGLSAALASRWLQPAELS